MGDTDTGVTFTGKGDPLDKLDLIVEACDLIKEARHGLKVWCFR